MNVWEALIGAPPQGPEETQRIAQQLRRNAEFGLLGQITGDRVLAPAGQSMRQGSFDQAKQLQQQRQFGLDYSQKDRLQRERLDFEGRQNVLNRTLRKQLQDDLIQHQRGAYTPLEVGEGGAYIPTNPYTGDTRPEIGRERAATGTGIGGLSGKDLLRYTRDLSRDLEQAKLPEIDPAVAQVDEALAPYAEGNIPGVGAGKYSPGSEARAMRNAIAPIRNILLLARSGAAVTEQEYERFKQELLGEGMLASDEDFRRAWEDLKLRIDSRRRNIFKGYHPAVVDFYVNGTVSGMEFQNGYYVYPQDNPSAGAVRRQAQGRDFESEYDEFLNPEDEDDY